MKIDEKTLNLLKLYKKKINNCTILITGATGMMGQNMVAVLVAMNDIFHTNIKIIVHARNNQKYNQVFRKIKDRKDIVKIISDITQLDIDEDIDYIIHTAGVTGGSKQHIDMPMRTISIALEGTKNVLDIALRKKSKGVVYLSSLEIYGNNGLQSKDVYETDGGYIDSTNVRSSYSESKRMCECMCASYTKQYGVPTYIARLTATFGYGVAYADNRVFAQFARSVIEKKI